MIASENNSDKQERRNLTVSRRSKQLDSTEKIIIPVGSSMLPTLKAYFLNTLK